MPKPQLKIVKPDELRKLFNDGGYAHRVKAGEFTTKVIRQAPPGPKIRAKEPPGTMSQIIAYIDAGGKVIAIVHQYLRPDGGLGGSGRPDPKRLLLNGVLYETR